MLRDRIGKGEGKCEMCEEHMETLEHFLWGCVKIWKEGLFLIPTQLRIIGNAEEVIEWMLHAERNQVEWTMVNNFVRTQRKERDRKMASVISHPLQNDGNEYLGKINTGVGHSASGNY